MPFDAYDRSLDLIRALAPVVRTLTTFDPKLVDQLRRAASSVAQNIREGAERTGKDRRHHYRVALGSAAETAACLDLAVAWGYVPESALTEARVFIDRVRAITWRLCH